MSYVFNEQKGWIQESIKAKGTFQVGFYGYYSRNSTKMFDKGYHFFLFSFNFYAYSKIQKNYDMDRITTEEVMDKLGVFQSIFGKIEKICWWNLEKNQ